MRTTTTEKRGPLGLLSLPCAPLNVGHCPQGFCGISSSVTAALSAASSLEEAAARSLVTIQSIALSPLRHYRRILCNKDELERAIEALLKLTETGQDTGRFGPPSP